MIDMPCLRDELYHMLTYDELMQKFSAVCKERDELKRRATPLMPHGIRKYACMSLGWCPVCYEDNNSQYSFCPRCGQALDWSECE